jgi:hypothetical protein
MTGYDIDGVLTVGYRPQRGDVVISGRTFAEYDDTCRRAAEICPVYIRGVGKFGDEKHAGEFKAQMIHLLGVTRFYEDSACQIEIIQRKNPDCEIIHVKRGK